MLNQSCCLVSSCLVGLCTRYDSQLKTSTECLRALEGVRWIPVCPEQLGGLATPRPPADLCGGSGHDALAGHARVVTHDGVDLTRSFIHGAEQVLEVARLTHADCFFAKSGSPSCGFDPVPGVTTALLLEHGLRIRPF